MGKERKEVSSITSLLLVHASTWDVCGRLFGRVLFGTSFLCTVRGRLRGNSRGGRFWCLSAWLTKRGSAVQNPVFILFPICLLLRLFDLSLQGKLSSSL